MVTKPIQQWLHAKLQSFKFWLHAESSIYKYASRLSRMTDAELQAVVIRERSCRGWTSERSYYLCALRKVCEQRKIQFVW